MPGDRYDEQARKIVTARGPHGETRCCCANCEAVEADRLRSAAQEAQVRVLDKLTRNIDGYRTHSETGEPVTEVHIEDVAAELAALKVRIEKEGPL